MKIIKKIKLYFITLLIVMVLIINKILIKMLPFRVLLDWYCQPLRFKILCKRKPKTTTIASFKRIMTRLDRKSLIKFKCFEQSLTTVLFAKVMNLDCRVYFGIRRSGEKEMQAHAWSQIGELYITGFANSNDFSVVYQLNYKTSEY